MTKENAHLYLPLVQALADGKIIQVRHYKTGEWKDWGWSTSPDRIDGALEFDEYKPECFRIKAEPKTVPLGPEDFPPGSAIRKKGDIGWIMPTNVNEAGITAPLLLISTFRSLVANYEIKRPGQDWQPCSKQVSE